jgi:hypothetical protein
LTGCACAALVAISAQHWQSAIMLAGAIVLLAVGMLAAALALQPAIEIHETHLRIGSRAIEWKNIAKVDRTRWLTPLGVRLTMADESHMLLVHPGNVDSGARLLRHIRRYASEATLDGVPYRQYWGEIQPKKGSLKSASSAKIATIPQVTLTRYPVLQPEDEAEVQRMFECLKASGRIDAVDPQTSGSQATASRADSGTDSKAAGDN